MLFQEDINQLETELLQLQQRIHQLQEAEAKAETTTSALQQLITSVRPLGKLSDLKSEVLALFGDDDDGDDGEPRNIEYDRNEDQGTMWDYTDNDENIESPPLTEPETSSPDGEHCSQMESTREVEPAAIEESELRNTELKMLCDRVGYLVNARGEILAGYAGFSNKRAATTKGKALAELLGMQYEVRNSKDHHKQLPHKYELKLLNISIEQLQRLADELAPVVTPTTEAEQQQAIELINNIKPTETDEGAVVERQANDEPTYLTGDMVEIISERHGAEFFQRVGKITAASRIGAVIDIDGTVKWYGFDEIQPLKDSIIQPPAPQQPSESQPASPYTFVLASGSDNIFTIYQVYEGNSFIGKVEKTPIGEKWTYKYGAYYPTKEAAAAAMDAERKRDERGRKELSLKLINQYAS